MLKFLVRKANGLLQTHLGVVNPRRGELASPHIFWLPSPETASQNTWLLSRHS